MTGPIKVRCPNCNSELKLKDRSAVGKRVRCPKCSTPFRLGKKKSPAAAQKAAKSAPPEDDFLGALNSAAQDDYGLGDDEFGPGGENEFDFSDEEAASQLPTRRRSSKPKPAESDAKPKKKRKKKRRKQSSFSARDSMMVSFLIWVGCGSAAGAIGAAIWAAIGYYTGYEIGIVAWAIGGLVGFGVAMGGGEHGGQLAGITGAVLAVLSILAGKFFMALLFVQYVADEVTVLDVNDPNVMVAQVAIEVAAEMEDEERTLEWPPGSHYVSGDFHLLGREDFPAIVWSSAQARWKSMEPEEQQTYRDMVEMQNDLMESMTNAAGRSFMTLMAFVFTFGWRDIIWFILAIPTAYRLSMGIIGDD